MAAGRCSVWGGFWAEASARSRALATEAEKTSVAYGLHNYLMNDPDYCKLYSIEGGMDRLVGALRDAIQALSCAARASVHPSSNPGHVSG